MPMVVMNLVTLDVSVKLKDSLGIQKSTHQTRSANISAKLAW